MIQNFEVDGFFFNSFNYTLIFLFKIKLIRELYKGSNKESIDCFLNRNRVKNLFASNLFRGAITQSGSGRVTRYLACISIGDWELAGVIPMGTWAL